MKSARAYRLLLLALLAGAAAPAPLLVARAVPVLHFAIDQDYTPQTETIARVAQDFPLVRALNIRILRTGIGWDDTNPGPRTFRWGYWAGVMAEAGARGIALRPYYAYTPGWAGAAYNAPPQSAAAFARACGVMAAALGSHVGSFEVWNEPDNASFWTGTAGGYGRILAPCAAAIHRVAPHGDVVLGGLVYLDSNFYAQIGEGALRTIDVAAFHEYTETPWDPTTVERDNGGGYFDEGYDIISGRGRRDVVMNEGGASTAAAQGYTEQTQASWIRRTVASLLGHPGRPIALIGLYQLRDPDPNTTPIGDPQAQLFFHHTGLFTNEGHPKLAAYTTADLVSLLNAHRPTPLPNARYVPSAGQPSSLLRLIDLQREDGRQIVFLWDRKAGSAGTIVLPTPGRAAFLHQADGTVVKVADFDGLRLNVARLEAGSIPLLYEVR